MADRCEHCMVRMDGLEVHADNCPVRGPEIVAEHEEVKQANAKLREELEQMTKHANEGWKLANTRTRQWKDAERQVGELQNYIAAQGCEKPVLRPTPLDDKNFEPCEECPPCQAAASLRNTADQSNESPKDPCRCWMSDNTGPGGRCRTCGKMPDMVARQAEIDAQKGEVFCRFCLNTKHEPGCPDFKK